MTSDSPLDLLGGHPEGNATADDLQGLLLQIVLALLMVFMIAYFIFVSATRRQQEEQLIDLNRQKLLVALERTAEDHRIRYGLNALMTQSNDGRRIFEADTHIQSGRLHLAKAARSAFTAGARAAHADYADLPALHAAWRQEVLTHAALSEADLKADQPRWLDEQIAQNAEAVRLDTRGVQRALAARLLDRLVQEAPADSAADPAALAQRLKTQTLQSLSETLDAPLLP